MTQVQSQGTNFQDEPDEAALVCHGPHGRGGGGACEYYKSSTRLQPSKTKCVTYQLLTGGTVISGGPKDSGAKQR